MKSIIDEEGIEVTSFDIPLSKKALHYQRLITMWSHTARLCMLTIILACISLLINFLIASSLITMLITALLQMVAIFLLLLARRQIRIAKDKKKIEAFKTISEYLKDNEV